jgi:hypothetical protein
MRNLGSNLSGFRSPFGRVHTGGFSPASLFAGGAEGAWFDPSDLSTLFQDNAGTTPVTASGQSVGKMLDKSGNGNHATQATPSKRPIYTTGGGLSWLAFDGADDVMATADIDFTGTNKSSVFAGVRKIAGSGFRVIAELSDNSNNVNGAFRVDELYGCASRGTVLRNIFTATTPPDSSILTMLADIGAPILTFRINGSVFQTNTSSQGTGNYGNHVLNIGARANNLFRSTASNYGLIVVGKTMSSAEIASTEAYMAAKSGVTL